MKETQVRMRKAGPSIAIVTTLAAAVVFTAVLSVAVAQPPGRGPQWDMWNPDWLERDMWGPRRMGPGMRQRMARHWTFMHEGIPEPYVGARNPLSPDTETIDAGRVLYQENCASCHGPTGLGDGEAGQALNPSPALLAYMIQMPMAVDEYLLWSISDGGAAFETAMPAFKEVLDENEIWKIIIYMRAGFPPGH